MSTKAPKFDLPSRTGFDWPRAITWTILLALGLPLAVGIVAFFLGFDPGRTGQALGNLLPLWGLGGFGVGAMLQLHKPKVAAALFGALVLLGVLATWRFAARDAETILRSDTSVLDPGATS